MVNVFPERRQAAHPFECKVVSIGQERNVMTFRLYNLKSFALQEDIILEATCTAHFHWTYVDYIPLFIGRLVVAVALPAT